MLYIVLRADKKLHRRVLLYVGPGVTRSALLHGRVFIEPGLCHRLRLDRRYFDDPSVSYRPRQPC